MRSSAAAALLALVLLTGCTGGSDSGGDAASGTSGEVAAGGGGTTDSGAVAPAVLKDVAPLAGRSVVRSAELRVEVPDVRVAADRAGEVARGSGGVVSGEEASDGAATLQLKVPPARLDDALTRLSRLGEEVSRQVGSEDVTEQVVDLDSRLATQRASVARVRALLDRATGLGDVVKIEGELAKREAELESLDARARALGARVDLSSVVVHLQEDGAAAATAPGGFRSGLDAGWTAFTTSARVLAAVTGAVLPFLPVLLVVGLVWRWRARAAATERT